MKKEWNMNQPLCESDVQRGLTENENKITIRGTWLLQWCYLEVKRPEIKS